MRSGVHAVADCLCGPAPGALLARDSNEVLTKQAATDLVIDVVGWISSGPVGEGQPYTPQAYTPIDPARILDTRTPVGECTPTCTRLAASSTITVQVAGRLGVPQSGAAAVALNLTATAATGLGTIKAYASGHSVPSGTSLIYDTSDTANMALVALGEDGRIAITNEAATDLVIDVVGWYSAASGTWSYGYSPDGLRTTKAGPVSDVSYTWDRSGALPMLLATNTAGTGATYYIYGPAGLVYEQINPDGSVYYLHHDQLGSTRLITDSSGAVVGSASYDAYGNPSATTGDVTTDLGYAGQYVDAETGYQYLRARFYDPATGQFLTRDPLVATTREAYGYVGGNPLNGTDPSGLWVAGYCGDGALGFVAAGGLQGCVVTDGNNVGLAGTAAGGAGSPTVSLKNGFMYSNADTIEDLRGKVMCIGGGGGDGVVGGVEVCMGMKDDGRYNGTFSVYVSGGVGAEGLPLPAEGHGTFGYTGVTNLFSFSSVWDSLCNFFDSGVSGTPFIGTTTPGTTIPS